MTDEHYDKKGCLHKSQMEHRGAFTVLTSSCCGQTKWVDATFLVCCQIECKYGTAPIIKIIVANRICVDGVIVAIDTCNKGNNMLLVNYLKRDYLCSVIW